MTRDRAEHFLGRLDGVEDRLSRLAGIPAPGALTEPDEPSGERWDWGQVWAHIAEFPAYWTGEIRGVLARGREEPVQFGRVKSDPGRVGSIERDRHVPAPELLDILRPQLEDLRTLLHDMSPSDWSTKVSHQTRGTMGMEDVMEEFLVGHLEGHADQLDALLGRS
jgi:hypothetical protein